MCVTKMDHPSRKGRRSPPESFTHHLTQARVFRTERKHPVKWFEKLRADKLLYYALRLAVRVVTAPFCFLPESNVKRSVQRFVLSIQHSLPIELAINSGETVVQVGTPWPRTLKRYRRAIGKKRKLVIIEAAPRNYERLKATVRALAYMNVELVVGAAWSETIRGQFHISPYAGDSKIVKDGIYHDNDGRPGNQEMKTEDCQFYRLDDLLPTLGVNAIDFLSVTVNGAELEVLRGARNTLDQSDGVRVYAKGHALTNGEPLNKPLSLFLSELGFATVISRGEPSSSKRYDGGRRAGDIFAWKPQPRSSGDHL